MPQPQARGPLMARRLSIARILRGAGFEAHLCPVVPPCAQLGLSGGLEPDDTADQNDDDGFDPDARSCSTEDRYKYVLTAWIEPRWAEVPLKDFVAGEVEQWLRNLKKKPHRKRKPPLPMTAEEPQRLAPGTRAKIRSLMSVLFNHAIRWNLFASNPISGPERKSGVRQSSKRQTVPGHSRTQRDAAYLARAGHSREGNGLPRHDHRTSSRGVGRTEMEGYQFRQPPGGG